MIEGMKVKKMAMMVSAGFLAMGLVGCKTTLPKPESADSTLLLAPFEAETKAKSSSVWVKEYVLNQNEDMTLRVDPKSTSGNFVSFDNLAPGEYQITALNSVPVNRSSYRAIGSKSTYELDPEDYISFEVKAGEITLLPVTMVYEFEQTQGGRGGNGILRSYPRYQTVEERKALFSEVKALDNASEWTVVEHGKLPQ